MEQPRPNFYAGPYLERRAEAREDPEWVAAAWADTATTYVVARGTAQLVTGDPPRAALLTRDEPLVRSAPATSLTLLGWFHGVRCVLIALAAQRETEAPAGTRFEELRPLSALLPAVIVTWISGGLFIAELAIFTDANVVSHVVTEGWLLLFFACTPLLGLIAVAIMTAISSRVNDTRTAQQLSIWGIIPVAGLILGELSGQFELTVLVAVIATGILIPLAILSTWGAAQLFQRETILTRWK